MIPYFQFTSFPLGPLTIQVWGLLVSAGILSGLSLAHYLAKKNFLSPLLIMDLGTWALVGGLIGARFFHIFVYEPHFYFANPGEMIQFWHGGASSLGGFVGAAIAVWLFAKKRGLRLAESVPYFDVGMVGLWLGWGIGRLGCFLIHDHPGTLSHFVGAVRYEGGSRHDLGLYESIAGFVLFAIFFALFTKLFRARKGLVTLLSIGSYALVRFFLDFLRATDLPQSDIRYLFLTPAQWGMMVIVLTIGAIFCKVYAHKADKAA